MHDTYLQLMYSKYTLFHESPKNWGYLRACTNSVYQASPREEGPGDEVSQLSVTVVSSAPKALWVVVVYTMNNHTMRCKSDNQLAKHHIKVV